jgi:hypothetical protein
MEEKGLAEITSDFPTIFFMFHAVAANKALICTPVSPQST